jgi:hypothetical protein
VWAEIRNSRPGSSSGNRQGSLSRGRRLSLFLSDCGRHVIGMIPFRGGGSSTPTKGSVEVEFRLDDMHFSRRIDRSLSGHDWCPGSMDLRRGDRPLLSTKPAKFGFKAAYSSAQKTKGRSQLTSDKTRSSPCLDLFLGALETQKTPPCISKRS